MVDTSDQIRYKTATCNTEKAAEHQTTSDSCAEQPKLIPRGRLRTHAQRSHASQMSDYFVCATFHGSALPSWCCRNEEANEWIKAPTSHAIATRRKYS